LIDDHIPHIRFFHDNDWRILAPFWRPGFAMWLSVLLLVGVLVTSVLSGVLGKWRILPAYLVGAGTALASPGGAIPTIGGICIVKGMLDLWLDDRRPIRFNMA